MFDRKVCTNPNKRAVNDALESFPSGHATAAFAGFGNIADTVTVQIGSG